MNTDRLFEFQTLAQVLHYGKAAKKLYMAQSVLSRHIQALEQEVGAQLFQRSPHGVSLTSAGASLYRASWDYMKLVNQSAERVRSAGVGVAGSVRFACLEPVMRTAVENFLIHFQATYPDILLTVDIIGRIEDIEPESYHCLAIPSSALNIPDNYQLCATVYEKSWLLIPPGHSLQPGGEASLSVLAGETLFISGFGGSVGSFARVRQMAEQATGGRVHIVHVPTPATAMLNATLGKGFAILPRHLLDERSTVSHHAAIKEDCRFELLFYRNTLSDDPAAQLFCDEFCRLMVDME